MRLFSFLMLSLLVATGGVSFGADLVKAANMEGQAFPPASAPIGAKVAGAQIGVWTNNAYCKQGKTPKFWVYAKSNGRSPITISSGGNLYQDSYLYVYNNYDEIARIPVTGPAEGLTAEGHYAGGFALPANLPKGYYTILWKTAKLESNAIDIEIL